MFKPKRSALVKRLWKNRISQHETVGKNETPEELELKATTQSILKRLKEKNLEILIQSIESKGGESTPCVLLPSGDIKLGRRTVTPNMLCCQIWRWPDLSPTSVLRQLPCCETVNEPSYTCCNPYHWSIEQKTDFLLPNLNEMDSSPEKFSGLEWSDDADMSVVSTETGNTPTPYRGRSTVPSTDITGTDSVRGSSHWCTVAYWELRQRVGRLYTVKEQFVNIFQDLPHGSGLALKLLQGKSDLDSVIRTREKIGFGIILSKEQDGVWMCNRSLFPVFVNSPTLDIPNSRTLVVVKVNPGYSLKIFDYDIARVIRGIRDPRYLDGPYDPSSIRISFAKGWGPTYHRQFITSCPCWVEVLLNVNR